MFPLLTIKGGFRGVTGVLMIMPTDCEPDVLLCGAQMAEIISPAP
jgi:hypothetical protein